jgi:feruloyl-CoA synthase
VKQTAPLFAAPSVIAEERPGGVIHLRSGYALGPYPNAIGAWLAEWAERAPARCFLAQRGADGEWRRLGYGEAFRAARAIGAALLARGLGPERPVMILSDNGIDHALLALGAMQVGVPVAPISTAYSRLSQDFLKLRSVRDQLEPGLIFADDGALYGRAIAGLGLRDAELVVSAHPPPGLRATEFAALLSTAPGPEVAAAEAKVGPDTVAKILFTSGSTGEPKGVVNTQRMLCSNQQMYVQVMPFLAERPPVIVDWLPWNHTFGGNSDFNMILANGGTLYIDEGKPVPALIGKSVANLRDIAPSLYFNVPRGYALILDHLERDQALARHFFSDLDLLFYAGAALPQSLWDRLEALSLKAIGRKVPMISGWGTTETAPMATVVHYPIERAGNIGVPAPGTEAKLVPHGDKLELRVRGPNITPGYWKRPDLTREAFDAEGFYRPGDAARLADPREPARGILFDGRIGENFKLGSGTWVSVGSLRVSLIAACAPVIEDCVICGHDRDAVAILVFASLAGCRGLCAHLAADAPLAALVAEPAVRGALASALERHNAGAGGSTQRIAAALLMAEPPLIDRGEITDKGYINQRAVLRERAHLVERLYAEPPAPEVIRVA